VDCKLAWIFEWLKSQEYLAVWAEGIALVAIFIWDRWDASQQHQETVEQLKIAQEQLKIAQDQIKAAHDAERAWVMTELDWPEQKAGRLVLGTCREKGGPQVEMTTVVLTLTCRNEGRSPAWIDKIEGYCEIVQTKVRDLPSPDGHAVETILPIEPIAPGKSKWKNVHLTCDGHLKNDQILSIFVRVEYRDAFASGRYTTCGYNVAGDWVGRQDIPDRNRNI
jgi:hypothetical protein